MAQNACWHGMMAWLERVCFHSVGFEISDMYRDILGVGTGVRFSNVRRTRVGGGCSAVSMAVFVTQRTIWNNLSVWCNLQLTSTKEFNRQPDSTKCDKNSSILRFWMNVQGFPTNDWGSMWKFTMIADPQMETERRREYARPVCLFEREANTDGQTKTASFVPIHLAHLDWWLQLMMKPSGCDTWKEEAIESLEALCAVNWVKKGQAMVISSEQNARFQFWGPTREGGSRGCRTAPWLVLEWLLQEVCYRTRKSRVGSGWKGNKMQYEGHGSIWKCTGIIRHRALHREDVDFFDVSFVAGTSAFLPQKMSLPTLWPARMATTASASVTTSHIDPEVSCENTGDMFKPLVQCFESRLK